MLVEARLHSVTEAGSVDTLAVVANTAAMPAAERTRWDEMERSE